MSFLARLFRADPQVEFTKGRRAFDVKNYREALKRYEKAYKLFSDMNMKITALDNAALSAEKASLFTRASELYYQLIVVKMSIKPKTTVPSKFILQDIERTINTLRLSQGLETIPINKLHWMKFLILLAECSLEELTSFYESLENSPNDDYKTAFNKTWLLIQDSDTFVNKSSLPRRDLPKEFNSIEKNAERIMQRLSLCQVSLQIDDSSILIQKGAVFTILGLFTVHAALSINSIILKVGTKGRIESSSLPKLPQNFNSNESQKLRFSLIPNFPGDWTVGPLVIQYQIPEEPETNYSVVSNSLTVQVKEADPEMQLIMDVETLEEDYEYLVTVTAQNVGKLTLQNVKIVIDSPEGISIVEGTPEKIIAELGEGESFQFVLKFRFDVETTHFDGHIIKAAGFIDNTKRLAKSSIKIGGR